MEITNDLRQIASEESYNFSWTKKNLLTKKTNKTKSTHIYIYNKLLCKEKIELSFVQLLFLVDKWNETHDRKRESTKYLNNFTFLFYVNVTLRIYYYHYYYLFMYRYDYELW